MHTILNVLFKRENIFCRPAPKSDSNCVEVWNDRRAGENPGEICLLCCMSETFACPTDGLLDVGVNGTCRI